MAAIKPPKLGQLLVRKGLLTEEQLMDALQQQAVTNRFLGTIVLERGWASPVDLLQTLSEQYRMPYARLTDGAVEQTAVETMPVKMALHYKVMPLRLHNSTLTVAIHNPQDVQLIDELGSALQHRYTIEPVLATEEDIANAIKTHYGVGLRRSARWSRNGKGPSALRRLRVPSKTLRSYPPTPRW